MKPKKDRHLVARPLPQLEAYVDAKLPAIMDTMRRMAAANVDEPGHMTITWQIFGKRPKVRDSNQFVTMLERILAEKLEEKGYQKVYVDGFSNDMSFMIMWLPDNGDDGE